MIEVHGRPIHRLTGLLLGVGMLASSLTFVGPSSGASAISTANLVAHWSFDQSSGSTLINNGGSAYNGTFSSTPTWTGGKINNALSFNGTDYVNIGNVPPINNVPNVTLTGWMKRSTTSGHVIVAKQTTNHDFGIAAFGDGRVYFKVSNGSDAGGSLALSDTNWHHYALVFNGTLSGNSNRLKAYVDGIQRPLSYTGTVPSATTSNTTPLRMGRATNYYSNGLIDDVWLFGRSLSAAEIQELATPPSSDTEAPSVPPGLVGQAVSTSQVNLSWTASTDNVGVTGYSVYRNGQSIGTASGTSFTDNGLSPSTVYTYAVAAYDAASNQSAQSTPVAITTPDPAPAPTVDLGVSPEQVASGGSITLSWSSTGSTACTASNGWTGSKAVGGSEVINNITSARTFALSCTGPGGQAADSVSVSVLPRCSDNLDNDSDGLTDLSDPGCVDGNDNDESDADVTAPSVPSNLSGAAISGSQINMSWNPSADNVGVTGYRIYRNGNALTTVASTSFQDTGLSANTTYSYSVSAFDAASNESAQSPPIQATTLNTTLTNGPLRKSTNGRYFMDASGKTIVLNGSHTWQSLQDVGGMPAFDYTGYLDFLTTNRHNFFRLWAWEQAIGVSGYGDYSLTPTPFQRTGPGTAYDSLPKFDVTRFNQAYFDRMRARVIAARDRGIFVSIMLFNGFSVVHKNGGAGNPCNGHPLNGTNNINNINVASNGSCASAHTLASAQVIAVQEAYVNKVIQTVGDLDNVLYEVSNESESNSTAWQYRIIDFIKSTEASRPQQHPVGMTYQYPGGFNSTLFNSPADWISPNGSGGYSTSPPVAAGQKVVLLDTDHIWGIGGDYTWMWRSITRGYSVLYMDCYAVTPDPACSSSYVNGQTRLHLVRNLGYARTLLDRTNLTTLAPQGSLASSGFALARTGSGGEYVVFRSSGTSVNVNLGSTPGTLVTEWLNPLTGAITTGTVAGGATRTITAPFSGAGVLYIHS